MDKIDDYDDDDYDDDDYDDDDYDYDYDYDRDPSFITNTVPKDVELWTQVGVELGSAITVRKAYDSGGRWCPELVGIHFVNYNEAITRSSAFYKYSELKAKTS